MRSQSSTKGTIWLSGLKSALLREMRLSRRSNLKKPRSDASAASRTATEALAEVVRTSTSSRSAVRCSGVRSPACSSWLIWKPASRLTRSPRRLWKRAVPV